MTIRVDSGNLLLYIYKRKIEDEEMLDSNQLLEEAGWNKVRLNNASQYLIESGFIEGTVLKGASSTKVQSTSISDITPSGINIIEAESEFKQNFGFTVNLGFIQINWGAQES
ncbi:MAG: hypothetical protein SYNGOMJ08_00025 [Candidatus Syntrophoarchaeum sp. GoM_oil]|nr:MAG: hypothetical protein SYNGOMJ08_00025 [Candidatus Syntrophoarchaeum sp. GoM_oil]